jgi:cyclic pyranopterin phosphate synthase
MSDRLEDGHGRPIGDVRISVTDRCNFRCQYCMPAEGLAWLERGEILTFEEIAQLVGILAEIGVAKVRLTGGEPLVRRELPKLVSMLRPIGRVEEIALTTNGYLLAERAAALVAAGVDRFNDSIDSLQRDRFYELTRRDALPQVLAGLEEIRAAIEAVHPLEPLPPKEHSTSRVYRFRDGVGTIGFVNPVSEPFCSECDRIRITAEHRVNEPGFVQPARTMSAIGG